MTAAPPKSFAALRQPVFRGYFLCAALAMMADSIEHVISYWIMWEKFRSPALAGFAVVSHWLPFLLFSLWSGALADRFDPRRIIQAGMVLFMAASLGWGALFLTDTLEMWHAAALLVLHGCAGVLWSPAAQLFIHDIVDDVHLHSAIRLTATARWLGLLAGPAVGGVILLALGPAWGILFNALIYVPVIVWLARAPWKRKVMPADRKVRALADVVATWRAVAGNRVIAAGALAAGLILEGRGLLPPNPRTAFVLAMLWCVAVGAFALATSYPFALLLLFVAGFLELAFFAMAQTLVQINAPAQVRGRVIGLFAMSALGLRAFSGVTVGLGGSLIGIHLSLALSAALLLALTVLFLFMSKRA
jgi:MFS family permease